MSALKSISYSEPDPCISSPVVKATEAETRVARLMQTVIEQKEEKVRTALKGRVNADEAILIGGDLFSMGYLAFQGAQIIKPSLTAIPGIAIATLACGIIAGTINLWVSYICAKQGLQAWENGDMMRAARLFLDCIGLFGIGTIMILASLALRVTALGAVSSFFATYPWLMPTLFFLISLPLIWEVGRYIYRAQMGKDLAAQLLNGNLNTLIHSQAEEKEIEEKPFHLQSLLGQAKDGLIQDQLARRMEVLQADMGVEAALEAFKLLRLQLLKEETAEQMVKFKEKVHEWNRSQYVRMLQQVLYTAAFGVSVAAARCPSFNTPTVNGAETFAMVGGNAIPLYMDTFWPFKRNTTLVVPHVREESPEAPSQAILSDS